MFPQNLKFIKISKPFGMFFLITVKLDDAMDFEDEDGEAGSSSEELSPEELTIIAQNSIKSSLSPEIPSSFCFGLLHFVR
jgi:hypothetical protein